MRSFAASPKRCETQARGPTRVACRRKSSPNADCSQPSKSAIPYSVGPIRRISRGSTRWNAMRVSLLLVSSSSFSSLSVLNESYEPSATNSKRSRSESAVR